MVEGMQVADVEVSCEQADARERTATRRSGRRDVFADQTLEAQMDLERKKRAAS